MLNDIEVQFQLHCMENFALFCEGLTLQINKGWYSFNVRLPVHN